MKQVISDNTVHGDNIYLRELQNFFFEVLGMMSITHYGAIGDGRTDNYGPLQVAIDDAHRRGLNFLYVPYGRFIYTGELINIGDLIFMGNPHAHIVNIRTGEEIEIHQFGWCNGHDGDSYTKEETNLLVQGNYGNMITQGSYIDLSGGIGSVVDLTPIPGTNTAYYMELLNPGEGFDVVGDFTYATVNLDDHTMAFKFADVAPTYDDRWNVSVINTPKIAVLSFQNTDTIQPVIYKVDNYVVRAGDTMTGSLAIGETCTASGTTSFAQGDECTASGVCSHSEGIQNTASGDDAHAEGYKCSATGNSSHAEGDWSIASGLWSHAEGHVTEANGRASHAGGQNTKATRYGQTAIGIANIVESGNHETHDATSSILVVGNGNWDEDTQTLTNSNAFNVDWNGTGWFSGDVYVGSSSGTHKDAGSKKLATEEYVNTHGNVITGTYTGSSSATTITAQGITEIKYAMIYSSDEKLTATILPNGDAIISRGENVTGVTEKVMAYHLSSVTISGNTITIGSTSMLNEDQSEYYYMIVG